MTKKILSILLALSMAQTMLAACNTEPVEDVENPNDQQGNNEVVQGDTEIDDGTLKLVVEGVTDYVIVRGENAYISEVTATTELQSYLKQITGVEIPIVTDATAPVEKEIVVGKTNREADGEFDRDELGDDGLVIKTNGKKLFLVGGEQRGTLYSVYTFLEEYLGVRYYHATAEKVPQMTTISLDPIAENKQIPIFKSRMSDALPQSASWSVKVKINDNTHVKLTEELGGGIAFPGTNQAHSMQRYVNYYTYFDTHPEYFAVDEDGNSLAFDVGAQCCLNNPDVLQLVIDGVRKMLEEKPYLNYVDVSENDGLNTCKCEKCRQVIEEDGTHTGNLIRFVNAVADAIKDEYPDVKIETLAYYNTIDAPAVTKPRDNVVVRFAPIEQCINHSTEECQYWTSRETRKSTYQALQEWVNVGCNLFVWDYDTNFNGTTQPYPAIYTLKDDVRLYADVTGVFFQGNSFSHSGNFEELRSYLIAKLMWDPYMSDEEFEYHINDFLQGYYGAGWEYIKAYIHDMLETVADQHHNTATIYDDKMRITYDINEEPIQVDLTAESFLNPETVDWTKYFDYYYKPQKVLKDFMENSLANFAAAEALANPYELYRIQQSKIQILTFEIYYLKRYPILRNLQTLYAEYGSGLDSTVKKEFNAFVKELIDNIIIEKNSYLFDEMRKYWISPTPLPKSLVHSKEEADLTQVPEKWY